MQTITCVLYVKRRSLSSYGGIKNQLVVKCRKLFHAGPKAMIERSQQNMSLKPFALT